MVTCTFTDCKNEAIYREKFNSPKRCFNHKLPWMICINDKKCYSYKQCTYIDCNKKAKFGMQSGEKIYCAIHKLHNMISYKSSRCTHNDCNKIPSFNLPGKPAKFCSIHKTHDMINVIKNHVYMINVIHHHSTENQDYNFHIAPNIENLV